MGKFTEQINALRKDIEKAIYDLLDAQPNKSISYGYGCEFLEINNSYDTIHIDTKRVFIENGNILIENAADEYEGETFEISKVTAVNGLVELYDLLEEYEPEEDDEDEDEEEDE